MFGDTMQLQISPLGNRIIYLSALIYGDPIWSRCQDSCVVPQHGHQPYLDYVTTRPRTSLQGSSSIVIW